MKKLLTLLALTCLVTAHGQNNVSTTSFDLAAAKAAIAANNQKFGTAINSGDSAAIINLYHTQAKAYPPNSETIHQRAQVASLFASLQRMGIKNTTLTSTEVFGGPDNVIETGTYEMSDGNKIIDKGKYLVVWRQENGQWKLYRDIWNSDMPPPQAAQ